MTENNSLIEENILKAGIWKRFENHNLDECVKEIVNYIKSVQKGKIVFFIQKIML